MPSPIQAHMTIASDARQHAQAHAIMLKLMTLLWRLDFGESDKRRER